MLELTWSAYAKFSCGEKPCYLSKIRRIGRLKVIQCMCNYCCNSCKHLCLHVLVWNVVSSFEGRLKSVWRGSRRIPQIQIQPPRNIPRFLCISTVCMIYSSCTNMLADSHLACCSWERPNIKCQFQRWSPPTHSGVRPEVLVQELELSVLPMPIAQNGAIAATTNSPSGRRKMSCTCRKRLSEYLPGSLCWLASWRERLFFKYKLFWTRFILSFEHGAHISVFTASWFSCDMWISKLLHSRSSISSNGGQSSALFTDNLAYSPEKQTYFVVTSGIDGINM